MRLELSTCDVFLSFLVSAAIWAKMVPFTVRSAMNMSPSSCHLCVPLVCDSCVPGFAAAVSAILTGTARCF